MNKPTDTIRRLKPELRNHVVSLAVLAVLTLAMFADVLFTNQAIVPAYSKTDLFLQFIQWRRFGFEQLRQGKDIPMDASTRYLLRFDEFLCGDGREKEG